MICSLVPVAALTGWVGSAAAEPGGCFAPAAADAAATYDFIHAYRSECATNKNYDRTFPDVTVATPVDKTNRLSVTTSTALAGAIASVR